MRHVHDKQPAEYIAYRYIATQPTRHASGCEVTPQTIINLPHKKGYMIRPPCEVKGAHMRAFEGAKLDLRGTVELIRIDDAIVIMILSMMRMMLGMESEVRQSVVGRNVLVRVIQDSFHF